MLPVIRWVLSELYPAEIDANSSAVSPANTGRMIDFLRENTAFFEAGLKKEKGRICYDYGNCYSDRRSGHRFLVH